MKNNLLFLGTVSILAISILMKPITGILAQSEVNQSKEGNYTISEDANTRDKNSGILFANELAIDVNREVELNVAAIEDDMQTIVTTQDSYNYANIVVQKDLPVEWVIDAGDDITRSCISYVVFPSIGIQGQIKPGENLISFVPTETGSYEYYCAMQMYYGTITVVDDISNFDDDQVKSEIGANIPTVGGGGCCGY